MIEEKSRLRRFTSVAVTVLIVLMLMLSGPASAVKVQLKTPSKSIEVSKPVEFTVEVHLRGDDFIPIERINVTGLPLGNLSFYPNGTKISGASGYSITQTHNTTNYGYGYGYGYEGAGHDGYNFGYGYNFGSADGALLKYKITIKGLTEDTYSGTAKVDVITGNDIKPAFSTTESYKFTIFEKPRRSRGSGGSSLNLPNVQTAVLVDGTAIYWGEVGKYVSSIEIPDETGSVTVELLSSNPTSSPPAKHVFKYLNINAAEKSGKVKAINFKISTSDLENLDIDLDNVALFRFNNNRWNELPTRWIGTSGDYELFSANTPGFSNFAIAAKEEHNEEQDVTAEVVQTPDVSMGSEAEPGGVSESADETQIPAGTPPVSAKWRDVPGFGSLAMISGLLVAVYVLARKK